MPIDSSSGFVAFPRGLTEWEWYDDPNTARLFFHLLLTANWQAKPWHGIMIQPGQLVTSRVNLAYQLKISERSVRTALEHLKLTGEVTIKTGSKYSIITINNYSTIVGSDQQNVRQPTSNRPATDHNLTIKTKKQRNKSSSSKEDSSCETTTMTTTESLEFEFRTNIGKLSANGKAELMAYAERMGEELVREIIRKCGDAGGRSWVYVRKALIEAETQGIKTAEEYRLTHPSGAGLNQRVDRKDPSGNDWLKDRNLGQQLKRLKKKEVPDVPQS